MKHPKTSKKNDADGSGEAINAVVKFFNFSSAGHTGLQRRNPSRIFLASFVRERSVVDANLIIVHFNRSIEQGVIRFRKLIKLN